MVLSVQIVPARVRAKDEVLSRKTAGSMGSLSISTLTVVFPYVDKALTAVGILCNVVAGTM